MLKPWILSLSIASTLTACQHDDLEDLRPAADTGVAPEETSVTDTAVAAPAHRVSSLAMAAGTSGVVVAYQLDCVGCAPSKYTRQVRGIYLGAAEGDAGKTWSAGDASPLDDPSKRGAVVAASALGDDVHVLVEDPAGALAIVGGFLPGGAVISSALKTKLTAPKQTQGATFGEKVNAGLVVSAGPDEVWLGAYDAPSKDASYLVAAHVKGDSVLDTVKAPLAATSGVMFLVPGSKAPLFAFTNAAPGEDGEVRVAFDAPVTAPIKGVPSALWSDGKSFRVAISQKDGGLQLWDGGRTTLRGPRVDEAACSAIAFDANGAAVLAQVGPKSTVLYLQKDTDLLTPTFIEPTTETIDVARVNADFAIKENGIKRCAVATEGDRVYVAWSEPAPADLAGDDRGLPTMIHVLTYSRGSSALKLKTKHDTVKNSINNVR